MNRDRGFHFPFRFERGRVLDVGGGDPQTNDDKDKAVRVCAEHILLTEKEERVMYCQVGAGLGRFLFDVIPGVDAFIPLEVRNAINSSCPRATVGQMQTAVDPSVGVVAVFCVVRHNDSANESVVRAVVRTQ